MYKRCPSNSSPPARTDEFINRNISWSQLIEKVPFQGDTPLDPEGLDPPCRRARPRNPSTRAASQEPCRCPYTLNPCRTCQTAPTLVIASKGEFRILQTQSCSCLVRDVRLKVFLKITKPWDVSILLIMRTPSGRRTCANPENPAVATTKP